MSQTGTATPSLMSLFAAGSRAIDLLPHLHRYALESTGGGCSVLFEYNPRSGALHVTSGYGLDELQVEPWVPGPEDTELLSRTFGRNEPTLVIDLAQQVPDLASAVGTAHALLIPLTQAGERLGLLVIGYTSPPDLTQNAADGMATADAFVAAIELLRLRRRDDTLRDLRDLIAEFSASISATLNLSAGLEIFCVGANRLFGADRTSVWIHDRRGRQLVLQGSSDPEHVARGVRVSADDQLAPAAVAMRRTRSEIATVGDETTFTVTVTVPLRGYRRALGTIVFDGVRVDAGAELEVLDRADELGRQLSNAVETTQLLDDVIRSRRELENAFDSIWHLVVVIDRFGKIVQVNEAFANRLGRTRESLVGQTLSECVGAELASWIAEQERRDKPDAAPPAMRELIDPALNGPFLFTMTDLVDQERRRTGMVLVARDLTPQSRLEVEREELRKRLTQSEKLAALGQFVAGIAHELNNPLQGVLGHLELLRVTGAFPKQLRKEVQTIYREADRAAKIVRNLLVFAGSRRLARRAVSLPPILQKVIALRSTACRAADIEVVRHYDQKMPRVQSDPLLLHQVFLNIMMNAEQSIAATGRPGRIEITSTNAGDRLVTTVRDTGLGIQEEALSRIFEPFYTTKEVGKGTGLGLAIAYGIVQEHGGEILAANHPDGGATFTVELPIKPGAERAKE
jgi:PAS domain S-box-containing protein